jgi:hypothetical protein
MPEPTPALGPARVALCQPRAYDYKAYPGLDRTPPPPPALLTLPEHEFTGVFLENSVPVTAQASAIVDRPR